MKNAYLAALALVGTAAYANTVESVFKKDTALPPELKSRILAAVEAQCSDVLTRFGLYEVTTTVRTDRIDQGIVDHYYSTTLKSQHMDSDGYHPLWTRIKVESSQIDINNPPEARWGVNEVNCN